LGGWCDDIEKPSAHGRDETLDRLCARGRKADGTDEMIDANFWPIVTLPQEFESAMPAKADKPEPTRMT
jgi:hypothetical protein